MASKKRKVYDETKLEEAIKEVKAGQPVQTTALKFNIPRTTLFYKSRGASFTKSDSRGPECILGQENEKHIVDWICYMKNNGFLVTKVQLFNSVRMLLNTMNKPTNLPNNMPGRHWYEAFRRRHPEIRDKVARNVSSIPAAVTEEIIRDWFEKTHDHLEQLGLLNIDPSRQLNLDQSAFAVLASEGDKTVYNIVGNDEKICLTVLVCGNAAGQLLPPMILFPYKRIPCRIAKSMPGDWVIGCADSNWRTSEMFYIVHVFHPWLIKNNIEFPVILYVDGHASHLSYPLTKFCKENKIILVALHPNATHILQPMDVAMFRSLKTAWSSEVRSWRMENNGESFKHENFAPLFQKALAQLNVPEVIKNGFKSTGLHPFSADAINYNKYFRSSKSKGPVDYELVDYCNIYKRIEHFQFVERNIDKNLLEQFKIQEESAEWNGAVENTALFLFWKKIKKSITPRVQRSCSFNKEKIGQREIN